MGKTNISIENESFLINGKLTYSEINTSKPQAHGLLMNARFIQGIFLSLSATQHGWIQTPIWGADLPIKTHAELRFQR